MRSQIGFRAYSQAQPKVQQICPNIDSHKKIREPDANEGLDK